MDAGTDDPTGVGSLVRKFRDGRAYYCDPGGGYKESEVRSEFIDPLFELLGWDVANAHGLAPGHRQVLREESQPQEDQATKFPDYTFRVDRQTRFYVEAKKPSVDVTTHVESILQARRYGYTAGHPLVVLTNFRDLVLYDTTVAPRRDDQPAAARIASWNYTEYDPELDEIAQILGRARVADVAWAGGLSAGSQGHRVPAGEEFIRQFNQWRLQLGEELYRADPTASSDELNDAVQRVLNRLIFVRMCEDRGIEGRATLQDAARSGNIAGLLNKLHRRYNTGLFDAGQAPLAARVQDTTLAAIVDELYPPYSPFSFVVLDAHFIGLVYEATLVEHLTVGTRDGTATVSLRKKREYEHREVVSTPQGLVGETIEGVLAALGETTAPPHCLDFAVGSGRFLLALYEQLLQAKTARQVAQGSAALVKTGPEDHRLSFTDKRRLLEETLFGIDIDYNAVEMCKFSLLVRLLQDESRHTLPPQRRRSILPDLSSNIVWGNTLVRSLPPSATMEDAELTRPLDLAATSLPDRFDICVGNPPYMSTERMKRFDEVELGYLQEHYDTAYRQFDKYFTFIEFAADVLKPGGVLGAVVPNKWMTVLSGQKLRDLLRTDLPVVRLDNYREVQLFPGKSTYVCCLIARKGDTGPITYAEPVSVPPAGEPFEVAPSRLPASSTGAWVLPTTAAQERALRAVTTDSIPLGNVLEPRNGIQTSAEKDEIYLITDPMHLPGGLVTWTDKFGTTNTVEEDLTRPFLKDSGLVQSFREVRPDRFIIFPYRPASTPSGWEVIPPDDLRSHYPQTFAYLSGHRTKLDRRKVPVTERRKAFYVYGRTQAIGYADAAPKILYSTNQRGDKYGLDRTGIVYASGGTAGEVGLFPRAGSPYDLDFFLGLLAQAPVELFLRKRGSVFRGGYYARGTEVIAETPVPHLDFDLQPDVDFHDSVVDTVSELRRLHEQTSSVAQRHRASHEQQIRNVARDLQDLFTSRWKLADADVTGLF